MRSIVLAVMAACALQGFSAPVDPKAAEWFPKEVREAELQQATRFDLAPGVEYGYAYMGKLFGHPGDLHVVKIDLAKAKVRPFVEEGALREDKSKRLRTTSHAAAETKALFSVNGGFFCWSDNPAKKLKALIPYYRMKLDGKVLESNAGGTCGLAFSADGKKVKVGRVPDAELPEWDNFIAGEGLVSNGKCSLGMKRPDAIKTRPEAPRTFLGMDAAGQTLWIFVTGGRRTGVKPSMGLSYLDAADVLLWFGCAEGVNMDGGGSTTLAVRKDALAKAKKPYTPEAHPAKPRQGVTTKGIENYMILNCTSDGNERAVLDHIQFLDEKSTPVR